MTLEPVVVVDLGSEPATLAQVVALCARHGASLVVHPHEPWSRSLALNVGARYLAGTGIDYLVTTDADMLFSEEWRAVAERYAAPDRYMMTRSRDLPPGWVPSERITSDGLLQASTLHPPVGMGAASVIPVAWFVKVRGYEEAYEVWSSEDNDLAARATWDGLTVAFMPPEEAVVAHQWHRRDWATDEDWAQIQRNRAILKQRLTDRGPIVANPDGWGGIKE